MSLVHGCYAWSSSKLLDADRRVCTILKGKRPNVGRPQMCRRRAVCVFGIEEDGTGARELLGNAQRQRWCCVGFRRTSGGGGWLVRYGDKADHDCLGFKWRTSDDLVFYGGRCVAEGLLQYRRRY